MITKRLYLRPLIIGPLFVAVHVLLYGLGLSIPIILSIQTVYVDGAFSLSAWSEAFGNLQRWGVLLGNSLAVSLLAVAIAVCAGTLLALAAFKARWGGRAAAILLIVVLACTPFYVSATAVLMLTQLPGLGYAALTAGVTYGVVMIPLCALLIGIGLTFVEGEMEEAALLEGSAWRVLWRVSIPRAGWSIAAAGMVVFWLVVTDYSITDILQVRTFAEEIYTHYQLRGMRAVPFVLSMPMMIVLLAGFCALHRWAGVLSRPPFEPCAERSVTVPVGRAGRAVAWLTLALLLGGTAWLLYRMIGLIDFEARIPTALQAGMAGEAHLETRARWWVDVLAIAPDWWNTILMASLTSVVVAALAVSVAWLWSRSRWWRRITGFMMLALLATPAPALAMTLYSLFNRSHPQWLGALIMPIYDSLWIDVLALTLRFLPLATLAVLPAIKRVPDSVADAARADGAGWLDRLLLIDWPQCRASAVLAAVMVMVLAIGELDCVHLVSPPGVETLSKRFFSFIHTGIDSQVATVCLAAFLTTCLPALLLFQLLHKRLGTSSPGNGESTRGSGLEP